ncbi:MAG: leucine-rich repeat domain-containing protein, partial [Clostridia bacterium]|nr:leucine-rich repeat domain-containing protein [Clostridia bacterium]
MLKRCCQFFSLFMVGILLFIPLFTSFVTAEEAEDKIDYSNLTPNQYMSKILLNYNYAGSASPLDGNNKTIPQLQLEFCKTPSKASTARFLCNELSKNDNFMKSVAAWEVLTFDPSEAYEEVENEIDYYIAILLSILDIQMNDNKFIEAWNCSANKTVMSLSKSINGVIESWHDIDVQYWGDLDVSELTDEQFNEVIDAFESASETKKLYTMLGNNLNIINLASNGLKSIKDIVETVAVYSQIAELGTVIDDVLGELYLNCRNNTAMGLAVAKVKEAFNENINSTVVSIFETSNELVKTGFKQGVGMVWDIALTGVLGSFGTAFKYGQAIGKAISNFCFSTDAVIEQFFALNAVTKFEDVLITSINSLASKYMNNESEANADKFMKAVELLFSVYDLGYDYTFDFVYTVNMSGIYNQIKSSYGKNETVESYRSCISSIRNSMDFIKNSITCLEGYRWYYEVDAPSGYEKYFTLTEESVVSTPPYSATKEVVYIQPMSIPEIDSGALLTYTLKNDKRIIITGCNPSAVGTLNIPKAIGGFAVREIASSAFANCTGITEVTMPSTLRTIDYRAFENCSNLTNVILNEGLKTIGDRAFSGTAITEITVPSTVENLVTTSVPADSAFYGANNLKTVVFADGMLAIPVNALKNNMSVVEVSIPNSVTTIGNNAFYGCTEMIDISIPNSVTHIGSQAFYGCIALTEMIVPDSITKIDYRAFENCSNLTSVILNEGLKTIG